MRHPQSHCARGHALTPENSYREAFKGRECRTCRNARNRRYKLKKKR